MDYTKKLAKSAHTASRNAYHPITSTGTGAAVMTTEGIIYSGCNVQSVISGLGCCAERCALYHAVSHGAYNFKALAIYFPKKAFTKPCGACLQLINEFSQISQHDIEIIMVNTEMRTRTSSINILLPDGYGPRTAGKKIKKYEKNRDVKVHR